MDVQGTRFERPTWMWIVAIWGGIALFDGTQTVFGMRSEGMHHAWGTLFMVVALTWVPWALATPWVVRLGHRFPPVQLRPVSAWAAHGSLCLSIAVITSAWDALLYHGLNPYLLNHVQPIGELWWGKFIYGLLATVILYGFILLVSFVFEARDRLARQQMETARLAEQLSNAQLNALRRQIEPHFLFNALNAIAGLVRERRNDAAVQTIAGLSDFLRRVIEDSKRQEVPLAEEMEFVEKYLEIQKVRFADRLQLNVDVPPELLPAQVPALLLQPIVENAVKHGIAKRVHGGEVRIRASRRNGTLMLSVYNDGPSLPDECVACEGGVGLANVRTRLHSLYGDEFDFSIRNQEPGGVETCVSLPFRKG